MADRLKTLRRIERVQSEMVKLAEWRLAAADMKARALVEDQTRLRDYVGVGGALGIALAQAALRSIKAIDGRIADVAREREAEAAKLATLRRRDRAIATMVEGAALAARRAAEAADLDATMEARIATGTGGIG